MGSLFSLLPLRGDGNHGFLPASERWGYVLFSLLPLHGDGNQIWFKQGLPPRSCFSPYFPFAGMETIVVRLYIGRNRLSDLLPLSGDGNMTSNVCPAPVWPLSDLLPLRGDGNLSSSPPPPMVMPPLSDLLPLCGDGNTKLPGGHCGKQQTFRPTSPLRGWKLCPYSLSRERRVFPTYFPFAGMETIEPRSLLDQLLLETFLPNSPSRGWKL